MHFYHLAIIFLACLSWHVAAKAEEPAQAGEPAQAEETSLEDTPEQLFETGNCPTDPKLKCDDPSCTGMLGMHTEFEQYTCTNQSPVTILGRPAVVFRCWCCPERFSTWCGNAPCAAPPGSRICQGETLRGCPCVTNEDRRAVAVTPLYVEGPPLVIPRRTRTPVTSVENVWALLRQFHDLGHRLPSGESVYESTLREARPPGPNSRVGNESAAPAEAGEMGTGNGTEGEASDGPPSSGDSVSSAFSRLPTGVGYIQYDLRKM